LNNNDPVAKAYYMKYVITVDIAQTTIGASVDTHHRKVKKKKVQTVRKYYLPEGVYLQFFTESLLMHFTADNKDTDRKAEFVRLTVQDLERICFLYDDVRKCFGVNHRLIKNILVAQNINLILIMPTISNLELFSRRYNMVQWMCQLQQLDTAFDEQYPDISFYPRIARLAPFIEKHTYTDLLKDFMIESYVYSSLHLPTAEVLSGLHFHLTCSVCGKGGRITDCDGCHEWFHIDRKSNCVSRKKQVADPSKVTQWICDNW